MCQNFNQSKINSISCKFTQYTMRKIDKNIRNAAYFALIYFKNLL